MSIIYLVGMPGCGKTTIGKKIAAKLNFSFIDLDAYIETKTGNSITYLFEHKGEIAFRKIEHESLLDTLNLSNIVVSCGGGTPAYFNNMELMNKKGITVFLNAPLTLIYDRLNVSKNERPLLKNDENTTLIQKLENLYLERLPFYNQSAIHEKIPLKNLETLINKVIWAISNKKKTLDL